MPKPWYDQPKYRRCMDGFNHEGRLELVTWDTPADQYTSEALGWGACADVPEGPADLKRKFEARTPPPTMAYLVTGML